MKEKDKKRFFLFLILLFAVFLRFYRLPETAMFIGDQGRDFLMARQIVQGKWLQIRGPQTSIPWLYLGPFFYYFLAFFLWLGNFNPIWPVYGTAFFGVLTIYLIYVLGKKLFDEEVGFLAAFFYAISPYAVLQSRIALHPSIYPVFVILFLMALFNSFTFQESIRPPGRCFFLQVGHLRGVFALLMLSFFVAVQLHLSAILLIPIAVLSWELSKSTRLPKSTRFLKLFFLTLLIMICWKIMRHSPFTPISYWWKMFLEIFSYGNFLGAIIALFVVIIGMIGVMRERGEREVGHKIIMISLLVIICGLTIKNSPAEHPYNLFLPVIILIFSYGLNILSKVRFGKIFLFVILSFFLITNCYGLMTTNYFSQIYGPGLKARIQLTEAIADDANGKNFSFVRCGPIWDYPSADDNYEYLLWWLSGKNSEAKNLSLRYVLYEPPEELKKSLVCENYWNIGKKELIFKSEAGVVFKETK